MSDLIERQEAIDAICKSDCGSGFCGVPCQEVNALEALPSAQPECDKKFVMLKVIDLNDRPYYSIIYLEDGREYEGYSSYDLMVISEYLKRYFGFAQPEIIRCRECKYNNMPPTAGNAGCTLLYGMTNQNGFCSLAERREDKA